MASVARSFNVRPALMQSTLVSGCPDVSATTASGAAFDTSELELQTFAYSIHTHAALFAVGTSQRLRRTIAAKAGAVVIQAMAKKLRAEIFMSFSLRT